MYLNYKKMEERVYRLEMVVRILAGKMNIKIEELELA